MGDDQHNTGLTYYPTSFNMRVASVIGALGAAAGAVAFCEQGFHCTNSHLHQEVRAYPIERAGHNRGEALPLPPFHPDLNSRMSRVMDIKVKQREVCESRNECPRYFKSSTGAACINGKADSSAGDEAFDCLATDLLAMVPIKDMDSMFEASDIWGWTDPDNGEQIAIIGMEDRTAFVKVTSNADGTVTPVVLATLLQSGSRYVIWSDMKVYGNYVFIIRESNHGLQIFDLTDLRQFYGNAPGTSPHLYEESTYFYDIVKDDPASNSVSRSSHNVVINEATGFAYLVGTKTCRGGLHVVDITQFADGTASPKAQFKGCFQADGYTHDAQCVIYDGPDQRFAGKELCWAYNEDTITLVDVSDKTNMVQISRETYVDASYTHQGWLTEDHRYVIANDELDEIQTSEHRTRTLIWDYSDLVNPVLLGFRFSADGINSVDHNLYIKGNKIHLSNYCSGYRVYEMTNDFPFGAIMSVNGTEGALLASTPQVAYFDTAPYCDYTTNTPVFQGAWSNYPYFHDKVIVSNIETGLFVLSITV